MRRIGILIIIVTVLSSCKSEHPKDYLTFSGTIENSKDSVMTILGAGFKKSIKIAKDGSFNDTLQVHEAKLHNMFSPNNGKGIVFLKNGYHLKLNSNASSFFKSFKYIGDDEAADSNNLFVSRFNFGQTSGSVEGFMILEKEAFLNKVNYFRKGMDSISDLYSNANKTMVKDSDDQNENFFKKLEDNYDVMHAQILAQKISEEKLKKGNKAPNFSDYENYKGGTSSLSDFKGNYVYIDIWATWCKPCIAQIPYLKILEEEYKDKNISFVSISTDDDRRSNGSWEKARNKWTTMVKGKNLTGIQLWAGKDDARFSKEYMIRSIPRFILIDPKGNIVDSNAKSPANPTLKEMLNTLPGI